MPPSVKFVQPSDFHRIARAGQSRGVAMVREAGGILPTTDEDTPVRRFVFSDGSVDLLGDTVNAAGWDLVQFKRNPLIGWSTTCRSRPLGAHHILSPMASG